MGQLQNPYHGKGSFIPFSGNCIAAAAALEIWIELGP